MLIYGKEAYHFFKFPVIVSATIDFQIDIDSVLQNLGFFAIGIIWMLTQVIILLVVAKVIPAPSS
jgi:hypothetical protein